MRATKDNSKFQATCTTMTKCEAKKLMAIIKSKYISSASSDPRQKYQTHYLKCYLDFTNIC